MNRRWPHYLTSFLITASTACVETDLRPVQDQRPEEAAAASYHPPGLVSSPRGGPMNAMAAPALPVTVMNGPQPVEAYIHRALVENRTVQAAFHNVQSLNYRIPQVTTLADPVASNTVFPIPSVAPQYSLMGYNPYNLTLAQQFPWFGTLRLRGEVAAQDVQVALAELAAAQLDAVVAVKRAYFDLYASQRTEEFLDENRKLLLDFQTVARRRQETGGSQQDVLRSEVLVSELDRELANNQQAIATARSSLARQIHVSPESDLRTMPELPRAAAPRETEALYNLAINARPELKGRLAAVARDEKAVELARKRFYPDYTLGLTYMEMEKTNAAVGRAAGGMPNVGLFVAFNLPVYRDKYRAGVCEAQQRAIADAKLYEAQRDETHSEIADLMSQAKVQQNVLGLLRDQILPRTRESLDNAGSDYSRGNVDFATLISALREVLQVELQIVQVEAELGKALASLERAVGCQINENFPINEDAPSSIAPTSITPPTPPATPSPFRLPVPDGSSTRD